MAKLSKRQLSLHWNAFAWLALVCSVSLLSCYGCSGGSAPPAESEVAQDAAEADGEHEGEVDDDEEESAAVAEAEPEVAEPGEAPFDTTYLDADTELFIYAKLADILDSSLVQTLSGGNLGPLDELTQEIGIDPRDVDSVTLGIVNLKALSEKSNEAMGTLIPGAGMGPGMPMGPGGPPGGFNLESRNGDGETPATEAATGAEQAVAVIRTRSAIDVESLEQEKNDRVPHGKQAYYRVKREGEDPGPCLFLADKSVLIVADEPTIQQIIDGGADRPRPTADLGFVKTLPHLLVAVAPKDKTTLLKDLEAEPAAAKQQSGSSRRGSESEEYEDEYEEEMDDESYDPSGDYDEYEEYSEGRSGRGGRGRQGGPTPELKVDSKLLEEHTQAIALLVDLSSGIELKVAVRTDNADSATKIQAEYEKAITQIRDQYEVAKESLPGMIQQIAQPLVDSLQVESAESVVTGSTKLPEEKQASLAMLPMAIMGMMMSGGMEMDSEFETMASRREQAQEVLTNGQAATNIGELPDGLELKALTRWGESRYGDQAPPPLEVGIVAVGGPAAQAIGYGNISLTEATTDDGTALKWEGAATDTFDGDPLKGFVPIERDGMFSDHPDDAVATGLRFVPPATSAKTLSSVTGQLMLQVAAQTEDVMLPNIKQAAAGNVPTDNPSLTAANMQINVQDFGGQSTLEVAWDESPLIGSVEAVSADGMPLQAAGSSSSTFDGRVSKSIILPGPVPEDLALRVVTYADLQDVAVPFQFNNLALPEPQELSEQQQALMVWTRGEVPNEHPDLTIEAQARWRELELVMAPQMGFANNRQRSRSGDDYGEGDRDSAYGGGDYEEEMQAEMAYEESGRQGSQRPQRRGNSRQLGPASDQPLRVVIDLIGPLAQSAEAIGEFEITSVKTDIDTDLVFEGADFGVAGGNIVDDFVEVAADPVFGTENPPGGLRIVARLTPPNQTINGLSQVNGTLKLRTVRERTEAILSNLQSRVGNPPAGSDIAAKPVNDRELLKFGLKPVVAIEPNRVMMRLLEGKDERISDVKLLDLNGNPLQDVSATTQPGSGKATGRTVYSFQFSDGVPQKIGMKISVNMGVKDIEIPIRLRDMPLPPIPKDEG